MQFELPPPRTTGTTSLEAVISHRRSVREFGPQSLTREQLSQLLWAAQGITARAGGLRTTPSAGACYPLEIYLLAADGVWHFEADTHRIVRTDATDRRVEIAAAAIGQDAIRTAPVSIVVTGVISRTRARYGARAERYVYLEAGHAAQNVLLQADALGLGAVPIGAFDDNALMRILALPAGTYPLYVIPVGVGR